MQRTKYTSSLTMSWKEFEKRTGFFSPNIHKNLFFAQSLAECAKKKLNKQKWICMNDIRELFGCPPCLDYQTIIYFKEFGEEPVEVEIAPNSIGIIITMRNYIDLCDEPIKYFNKERN